MGRKTVVVISDDYDGKDLAEDQARDVVLALVIDGETEAWSLCLSDASLAAWRKANEKFTAVPPADVRLVTGASSAAATGQGTGADPRTPLIRTWWEGLTPGQRVDLNISKPAPTSGKGKMPADVVAAYEMTHPEE